MHRRKSKHWREKVDLTKQNEYLYAILVRETSDKYEHDELALKEMLQSLENVMSKSKSRAIKSNRSFV
jgi:hypothetical protein